MVGRLRISLSLVGYVLVKSVVDVIVNYYVQCVNLPKGLERLDKTNREKIRGGLQLYRVREKNNAILAWLCWRLLKEEDRRWIRTIAAKYFKKWETPLTAETMRTYKALKAGPLHSP